MIQLTQGYSIRLANPRDQSSLLDLILAGIEDSKPFEEIDLDHLKYQLAEILQKPLTEACLLCLCYEQQIVGCLSGQKISGHFSPKALAVESHYYVQHNHRSMDSLKLLEAFEEWSRRVGCSEVYLSSGNDPRFAKLLQRKGYHEDKVIYKKVL